MRQQGRETSGQSVVLIGNFDGVHVGHQALIARARSVAEAGGDEVVVMSFDPHPSVALARGRPEGPGRLTTFAKRQELLADAGADRVVQLVPDETLLSLSPEEFIQERVLPLRPKAIVEGADFRFGHRRIGGIDSLRALGEGHGFDVDVVDDLDVELTDTTLVRASSSMARWLIRHGRVRDAARVLGRPHAMTGTVVRGQQRGRTIGFPTANIDSPVLNPADGVYACEAVLEDGRTYPAAVNVGSRPTVNGDDRTVEAYLIGPETEGDTIADLPEYGWPIELRFVSRVRDQVRFESFEALMDQIGRDVQAVTQLMRPQEAAV